MSPLLEIKAKKSYLDKLIKQLISQESIVSKEIEEIKMQPKFSNGVLIYETNLPSIKRIEMITRKYVMDKIQSSKLIDATELGKSLGIDRSHTSVLLNHLYREGYLEKVRRGHHIYYHLKE